MHQARLLSKPGTLTMAPRFQRYYYHMVGTVSTSSVPRKLIPFIAILLVTGMLAWWHMLAQQHTEVCLSGY